MIDFSAHTARIINRMGRSVMVDGVPVVGVFDSVYQDVLGVVSGVRTVLLCATSAVSTAVVGDAVVVGTDSYVVAEIQPDGSGMTRLFLK